ncbi:MAG: hypothetical protein GC200_08190 [Tepidisphaera sp.]|nr:hypothetical protein [Tepidisphaera sp.]
MKRPPSKALSQAAALTTIACALASLAGCYEHVVRAEGPGADRINTTEGRPNTAADRWFDENILGKEPDKTDRFNLSTPPATSDE